MGLRVDGPAESDAELLERHGRVQRLVIEARAAVERCRVPSSRARRARWAGSLYFTLLGIRSEMARRGLEAKNHVAL